MSPDIPAARTTAQVEATTSSDPEPNQPGVIFVAHERLVRNFPRLLLMGNGGRAVVWQK
jgi:hypothetical protein